MRGDGEVAVQGLSSRGVQLDGSSGGQAGGAVRVQLPWKGRRREVCGRGSLLGERTASPGLLATDIPRLQILGHHGDRERQCFLTRLLQESRKILEDKRC